MLPIMPVFYLLVPDLYALCLFSSNSSIYSQIVYLLLPYLTSRNSMKMPVDWPRAAPPGLGKKRGPSSLQARKHVSVCAVVQRWEVAPRERASVSGTFHSCSCLQSRVARTRWDPEGEICGRRGWRQVKLPLKEKECLGFKRPVSLGPRGAAIQRRTGSRPAPRPAVLLGAPADGLAALSAAFFPLPFVP